MRVCGQGRGGGVLHNSAGPPPPFPPATSAHLAFLAQVVRLGLQSFHSDLGFHVGEPAFQHLLHFQNDIDELAPERHNGMVEVKREARKGRSCRRPPRETTNISPAISARFLSSAVDGGGGTKKNKKQLNNVTGQPSTNTLMTR